MALHASEVLHIPPSAVDELPVSDIVRASKIPSNDMRVAWMLANIAAMLGVKGVKPEEFVPPWARNAEKRNEGIEPEKAVKMWVSATKQRTF